MRTIYLCVAFLLTGTFVSVAQLSSTSIYNKTVQIQNLNGGCSSSQKIHPQSNLSAAVVNDVGMVDTFPGPYTMIPLAQLQTINISARVVNSGTNAETNVGYNVTVFFIQSGFTTAVYSSPSATVATLNAGDTSANLSAGSFTPADTGTYVFEYITMMDTMDLNTSNDTLLGFIVVNDSTYARDFAVVNGLLNRSLGFSPTGTGTLGQKYDVYTATAVTSVTFYLSAGVIGDQVSASIFAVNGSSGIPTAPLGTTPIYTITAADTAGAFQTLSFTTPIAVGPGSFFAGVNQLTAGHNVSLAQCDDIYTPGTVFYHSGSWVRIDSTAFHGSFILRPNTSTTALGTEEYASTPGIDIYPNPSTGLIHIKSGSKPGEDFFVTVFNVLGKAVYSDEIKFLSSEPVIDLSKLPPSLYSVRVSSNKGSFNKSVILITN